MLVLKIVTINILSDLSRWSQRRELIARGLKELNPDVVALQEVRLPQNPANWLADQLGFEHIFLSHATRSTPPEEGIALISRIPFAETGTLDLRSQGRVAQSVLLEISGISIVIANGHYFWQPGDSEARLEQVKILLNWLEAMPGNPYLVACGDFNGTPDSRAIRRMRERFQSAYMTVHGREPEYTTPTPLPRSFFSMLRTAIGFSKYLLTKDFSLRWFGTLDYIFVDPGLNVRDSQVVLNQPDPNEPRIYPSDHFGIYAEIGIPEEDR
jgi:endonuclease/exonuclease/phosphatase family metal-dependent hydrolase